MTERFVEVRIGELLGPTVERERTDLKGLSIANDSLTKDEGHAFRLLAVGKLTCQRGPDGRDTNPYADSVEDLVPAQRLGPNPGSGAHNRLNPHADLEDLIPGGISA
jgi:hypothetical protein